MILHSVKDFVIPTLSILESLGGEANLSVIEKAFYNRYAANLDSSMDWNKITPNHKKPLWVDYCGSRVAFHHLKPEGYITVESHGSKGSTWKITDKGRAQLKEA